MTIKVGDKVRLIYSQCYGPLGKSFLHPGYEGVVTAYRNCLGGCIDIDNLDSDIVFNVFAVELVEEA